MARKEPQNIDAEISVLGCGFLERTALDKIMDEVTDEMFYSVENRTIYRAMKNLHTNNIPVDAATVCNELDKNKELSKVGGVEYITDIINSVPSTANLNYYIKIIFEKSILRNLINKTTKIQEECYEEQDSIVTARRGQAFLITGPMSRTSVHIEALSTVKKLFEKKKDA